MNTKIKLLATVALGTLIAAPVFAATSTTPRAGMRRNATSTAEAMANQEAKMVQRAGTEISARVKAMNDLIARVGNMKNVASDTKSILEDTVQSEISELTSLGQKIQSDTSSTTLKDDLQSITRSYRIYALVIPQSQITATADRAITLANSMTTLGTNLATRIAQAQAAGKDVSSLQSTLSDFDAKVADAKAQAQAAITKVAGLKPDQGNQTLLQANTAALKDARTKVQAANKDLVAARKDAGTITKGLRAISPKSSSSTATSSAQ